MMLGVFPLPIILLPQGVTQLRIFEQRYIRLVSEAARGHGFALSLYDSTKPFESSEFGAWVEIIDFSTLDDGMLSIVVKAKSLIQLAEFTVEPDGLRHANFSKISDWSLATSGYDFDTRVMELSEALKQIIEQYKELTMFYPEPQYANAKWVCARFIELLPLSYEKKQQLIFDKDFEQCLSFLHTVIYGEN